LNGFLFLESVIEFQRQSTHVKKKKDSRRAYIGIDIGGTKSLYALFDANFEVLAEEKLPTHPEKGGAKAFTSTLAATLRRLLRTAGKRGRKVRYVGVGCAGDIDLKRGIIRSSPNLSFLDGYPLREKLERFTGARAFVGHDVQSALYGELRRGNPVTLSAYGSARAWAGRWCSTAGRSWALAARPATSATTCCTQWMSRRSCRARKCWTTS
jgi:hypothetical protein